MDNCTSNSVIKVTAGHYKENLHITTPNLKIEGKDFTPEVFIMGNKGPAVYIDLDVGQTCTIQNIKFVHKGGGEYKRGKDLQQAIANMLQSNIYETSILEPKKNFEYYYKAFNDIDFSDRMDSMVYVKSGGVILRNC